MHITFKRLRPVIASLCIIYSSVSSLSGFAETNASANTPVFHPHLGHFPISTMKERGISSNLRSAVIDIDGDNEGLATKAIIEEYLQDWSTSHNKQSYMDDAWTLGYLLSYIDMFGLFELRPQAIEKALRLSKVPTAYLQVDGTLGLLSAASYFDKTDQPVIAEQIYQNLTSKLWPTGAPLDVSRNALLAYERFLRSHNYKQRAEEIHNKFEALNSKFTPETNDWSNDSNFTVSLEWQNAKDAHDSIREGRFDDAQKLISSLMSTEKSKEKHHLAPLSRILNLAREYAKQNRLAEAKQLMRMLVPLTDDPVLLNLRLYIFAELFIWSDSISGAEWNDFQHVARQIDALIGSGKTSLLTSQNRTAPDERVANLLEQCAVAYLLNHEAKSALKIYQALAVAFPVAKGDFVHYERRARLGYCYAASGDLRSAKSILEEVLKGPKNQIGEGVFTTVAAIIELCEETKLFKEGQAIADLVLDKFTSKPWIEDAGNPEAMRPYQLIGLFLALGKLQNAAGHFVDAEKNLRNALEFGKGNSDFRIKIRLALGISLEAQGRWDEAVDIYSVGQTNSDDTLPLFVQLVKASKNSHMSGSEIMAKLMPMSHDLSFQPKLEFDKAITDLLAFALAKTWNTEDIDNLRGFVYRNQIRDGNLRAATKSAPGNGGNPMSLATLQLDQGLAEDATKTISDMLTSKDAAESLLIQTGLLDISPTANTIIQRLIRGGANADAEKILRRLIELSSSSPEQSEKTILMEKAALANAYISAEKFDEALLLAREITSALAKPTSVSRLFQFSNFRLGMLGPDKEFQVLQYLVQGFEIKHRLSEATKLELAIVEAQKRWYPSGNTIVLDSLIKLATLYHQSNDETEARRILFKVKKNAPHASTNKHNKISFEKEIQQVQAQRAVRPVNSLPKEFSENFFFQGWYGQQPNKLKALLLKKLTEIKHTESRFSQRPAICMAELACAEIAVKRHAAAAAWLRSSEKNDPFFGTDNETTEPLICYAVVNYKLGKIDDAIKFAKAAVLAHKANRCYAPQPDNPGSCAKILAGSNLETEAKKLIPRNSNSSFHPDGRMQLQRDPLGIFFLK